MPIAILLIALLVGAGGALLALAWQVDDPPAKRLTRESSTAQEDQCSTPH